MIVRGGDKVDMLVAKAGVLESDQFAFIVRNKRHSWYLLTTNNGRVGLNVCPDKDIHVTPPESVILFILFG